MLDAVVHRKDLKPYIARALDFMVKAARGACQLSAERVAMVPVRHGGSLPLRGLLLLAVL